MSKPDLLHFDRFQFVESMPHKDGFETQQAGLDSSPPALDKIRKLKDKAKVKTKRVLNIDSSEDEKSVDEVVLKKINADPAFNSSQALNRLGKSSKKEKAKAFLEATVETIFSPKQSIKSRAARTAAGSVAKGHPYHSRKADLEFLEAHDDLTRAVDSSTASDEEAAVKKTNDVNHCQRQIAELEKQRQSIRVAWVTDRHVRRVRVINLVPDSFPDDSHFEQLDDCGAVEFQWGRWFGLKLLHITHNFTAQYIDDYEELPFDIDTLRRHLERLIVVSAPFQTTFSEVRRVYRWEKPLTSLKWMVLYFFLLHISHVMTFAYGYVIYSVVRNYYFPTSLESLREEINRSLDRRATAFKIGELMDKHGNEDWLVPLVEELGPYIQVQLADLANLLEVCDNFYHFKSRQATVCTLTLLFTVFLITLLTSAEYAFKVFWFIVGFTFFICWPISSHYPRYRLLVSPIKWIFWDIPTHAEWSFGYLQKRSEVAKETLLSSSIQATADQGQNMKETPQIFVQNDSDSDSVESFTTAPETILPESKDILSLTRAHRHRPGHLILSTNGLRFHPSLHGFSNNSVSFSFPFTALIEMSKERSSLTPAIEMGKLELRFADPEIEGGIRRIVLGKMMKRDRDRAFNAILGFSGVRWQCLQKRAEGDVV